MTLYYDVFETSYGWMGVVASEKGLRRTTLPQASPEECVSELGRDIEKAELAPDSFESLRKRLIAYFQGDTADFDDEPIDIEEATSFHQAAWEACRSIPRGETRTYKWLAAQAGKPKAPRAAGQSMAKNRLPIIIPCHRVVATDGSLRGFGKGTTRIDLKQQLLDLESK